MMQVEQSLSPEQTNELTEKEIWDRRDDIIEKGFDKSKTTLIDAPPISGKSYGVVKWAAETDKPLTVFAPRHDLLGEYENYCDEQGLSYQRLPSFYRDCGSFDEDDEPIDEAARQLKEDYERGLNGLSLHSEHDDLQCQADGECPFVDARQSKIPDDEVHLGTYRHAHRKEWIQGRYVAFDEFPGGDFLVEFDDGLPSVASAYLEDEDSLPFEDHFDLYDRQNDEDIQDEIEGWKNNLRSSLFDSKHVRRSSDSVAHTMGPIAVLALIEMVPLRNNWRYSDLGSGRVGVRNPSSGEWTFLLPPDLSSAESVIGLDGTPNTSLWEIALNERIESDSLLSLEKKKQFLRDVVGLRLIQTTDRWKAVQSGAGVAPPKELALIEGILGNEGRDHAIISSKRAVSQYERNGLDTITTKTEHYGNLKGMNDFGRVRIGVVIGNPHPGDHEIEKWSALAGHSAKRREEDGVKLTGNQTDYGPFGNQVMKTLVHDEVLQAAMRFGREKVDGVRGATVYVHTSAIPEWVPIDKQIPEIHPWQTQKNAMRSVIKAIQSIDGWRHREWKATEVYQYTSIGNKHVRNCLETLEAQGYIQDRGKKGQGGALHYADECLDEAGQFGHVEFPE